MAPPQGQMRPSRYLAVLAGIFVIMYAIVFLGGPKDVGDKFKPRLGLDLVGGSTVTLIAKTQDGGAPPGDTLEQARQIIEDRVNGLGVAEPEVVKEGDRNIVVSVAGQSRDDIKQIGQPAKLFFRKVISSTADVPDVDASPSPSASPGASATVNPSGTPTPTPSASASPSASPAPSGSASPGPSATPTPAPDLAKRREAVLQKLGLAAQAAQSIQDPATAASDPTMQALLEPFKRLSPDEIAALPADMQYKVPQVTCAKLNTRPAGSVEDVGQQAVACDEAGTLKYLLDVSKVSGTDVGGATAGIGQSGQWQVDLTFKGSGQNRWTALTKEAFDNTGGACQQLGDDNRCLVAVVLDNTIVSAPEIQSVITGPATISGSFTAQDAKLLANQLRYGALPLTFEQGESSTISATLGTDQLRAGLLAAGVGMLLVVIYGFFYYRLLGTVIFLSLALSGLLTYAALILLGRSIGFTLTLAGIAGFIVSLGVAADSFVIYFERLKDEIRDGRSPRSAVPRAWVRARRTIISANVVSILAAVVLYIVGVGSVKGFAFALGLATILDLVIVFLFRHPIMTLMANTKAFLSPRVSGLGRVLHNAARDEPPATATRVKEA